MLLDDACVGDSVMPAIDSPQWTDEWQARYAAAHPSFQAMFRAGAFGVWSAHVYLVGLPCGTIGQYAAQGRA